MRNAYSTHRPGLTALAAVLALTSTPLLAQAVEPAVEPAAPIVAAPPVAEVPAESPAATLNIPKISVDMTDAPAATAEAAPAPASSEPVQPRAKRSANVEKPAPVAKAPEAPAPVETAAPVASPEPVLPMAEAPVESAAPAMMAEPQAPVAAAPAGPQASAETMDDTLAIAGGVLAALALGGGALAFAGRKRRYREDEVAEQEPIVLDTPVNSQPVMAAAAPYRAPNPVVETAGTALPAGFDLSRFGRHVQAAYRGPSQDNPSLSLSKRLKRARFYDQRERGANAVTTPPVAPQAPVAKPVRQPEFVTSRRITVGNGGFRPAYQS